MSGKIYTYGNVETVWGGEDIWLNTPAEIRSFRKSPGGFYAKMHGATVEQYRTWLETCDSPRCAGFNRAGKRCRNFISGGIQRSLGEWVRLDRIEYCVFHGGLSSHNARAERWKRKNDGTGV